MDRRNQLGTALVGLAVVLFVVPALFPVQPVLTHDTHPSVQEGPDELREQGFRIVAYENLSERGQDLYVTALENGGEHRIATGEGAPDFEYLTSEERSDAFQNGDRTAGAVVVERPADDDHLPRSDERFFGPRGDEVDHEEQERLREQVTRYDLMTTATEQPPLGSTPQLVRLVAVLLAVLSLGVGGYLLSSK